VKQTHARLCSRLAPVVLTVALAACGGGGSEAAAAPEQTRARPAPPMAQSIPGPPPAGPGGLSGGAAWARGGGGGGGGGRAVGREALERNRRERIAREGPQRPPSERHAQLLLEGQELSRRLAGGLPADQRVGLERPPEPGTSDEQWVRERCDALLALNQESLEAQGDGRGLTGQAFLSQCRRNSAETFRCADRGEEGRNDPQCRQALGRLDTQVRTLQRRGNDVRHPDQRIDSLVTDRWETEREEVAPETLAPATTTE